MSTFARPARTPRKKASAPATPWFGLTGQTPYQLETGRTPARSGFDPAYETWNQPGEGGKTGSQNLYDAWLAKQPGQQGSGANPGTTEAATPTNPTPSNAPPPQLPTSAANIAGAYGTFGGRVNDLNSQLLEAAFRFGGAPTQEQYVYNPATGGFDIVQQKVESNDNSVLANIQRAMDARNQSSINSRLRAGTLRSGLRLQDVTDNAGETDRTRAQALHDYQEAVNKIRGLVAGALTDYQGVVNSSNAADLEAVNSTEPTDPGEETASPAVTATEPAPVATGGKAQPRSGSRKRAPRTKKRKK